MFLTYLCKTDYSILVYLYLYHYESLSLTCVFKDKDVLK